MLWLVLFVALINLALGYLLAVYFVPKRTTVDEPLVAPSGNAAVVATADNTLAAAAAASVEATSPAEDSAPDATIAASGETAPTQNDPAEVESTAVTMQTENAIADGDKTAAAAIKEAETDEATFTANDADKEPPDELLPQDLLTRWKRLALAYRETLLDDYDKLVAVPAEASLDEFPARLSAVEQQYRQDVSTLFSREITPVESDGALWEDVLGELKSYFELVAANRELAAANLEMQVAADPAAAHEHVQSEMLQAIDVAHQARDRIWQAVIDTMTDPGVLQEAATDLGHEKQLLSRPQAESQIDQWRRHPQHTQLPFSVGVIAVDRPAELNRKHGVAIVDRLLTHVGSIAAGELSDTEVVARMGGLTLLIFFPDAGVGHACDVVEHIRQRTAVTQFQHGDHDLEVRLSAGVTAGDPDDALDALFASAADALAAARQAGGNQTFKMAQGETAAVEPPEFAMEAASIDV